MKIVGLLIVKDEADILRQMLDHAAKWADAFIAIDNGSTDETSEILQAHPLVLRWERDLETFSEARMVPRLISMAEPIGADWFVDNDADEFFDPAIRETISNLPASVNTLTVNIDSYLPVRKLWHLYNRKNFWARAYKNVPELFNFSEIRQLHGGKIPILRKDRDARYSALNVTHRPIRSYEQGMRKYENYKRIDTTGIQSSYEHIREAAEALRTGDMSRVPWVR